MRRNLASNYDNVMIFTFSESSSFVFCKNEKKIFFRPKFVAITTPIVHHHRIYIQRRIIIWENLTLGILTKIFSDNVFMLFFNIFDGYLKNPDWSFSICNLYFPYKITLKFTIGFLGTGQKNQFFQKKFFHSKTQINIFQSS